MISGAIFDMDGLMFDTEPIWVRSWEVSFSRQGLPMRRGFVESVIGTTPSRVRKLIDEAYGGDPRAQAAAEDHFDVAISEMLEHGAKKKPGLDELLSSLDERDIPMAVASSSCRELVESLLGSGGVRGYFRVVVAGDDGLPSKPAPDIFLAASDCLKTSPDRTLVLEDSPNGIRAASAGGFISVMVPDMVQPDNEMTSLATVVCHDLFEVRGLLRDGRLGR